MAYITIAGRAKTNMDDNPLSAEYAEGLYIPQDFRDLIDSQSTSLRGKFGSAYTQFTRIKGVLVTTIRYPIQWNRKVSDDDVKELVTFTQNQWINGVGLGFSTRVDRRLDGKGLRVFAGCEDQMLYVSRTEN